MDIPKKKTKHTCFKAEENKLIDFMNLISMPRNNL